ncbi:hypothetical protein J3459_012374 [Metarhizium acridum]|nr:hypothetical protein J3459_012374 [Metarhizium acridum]
MRLLLVLSISVLLGFVLAGTGPKKDPNEKFNDRKKAEAEFEENRKVFTWAVREMTKTKSWAVGLKCHECLVRTLPVGARHFCKLTSRLGSDF